MASDGVFFFGVFLFFFLVWFVTGGPARPISFAGPYITPITDVNQTQEGYGTTEGWINVPGFGGSSPSGTTQSYGQGIFGIEQELRKLEGMVREQEAFGEPSPYTDQVSISGVSPGTTAKDEYFTIQLASNAPAPVTITGWRVRSTASGKTGTIPKATELPKSGINTTIPLTLKPGDQALVLSGESPIGVSFRENMCVGYFGTRQTFYPSLYSNCPSPYTEFERFYDGNKLRDDRCYAYVQSLGQCTTAKSLPVGLTSDCEDFVDTYLDYSGCVAAHRYESGFESNRYRVYLDRSSKLWKSNREAIKLLDENGKTVDLYTY